MIYPKLNVKHLAKLALDHAPLIIQGTRLHSKTKRNSKAFWFKVMWLRSEECKQIIHQVWVPSYQNYFEQSVVEKLQRCGESLQAWNHYTFVLGRLIIDNALIAFKTFHSLKQPKKSKNDFFSFKLDMSKVYDRVE